MKAILLIHDDIDFIVTETFCIAPVCCHSQNFRQSCSSIVKEGARIDLVILGYKVTIDDRGVLIRLRHLIPSVPFIVLATGTTAAALLN